MLISDIVPMARIVRILLKFFLLVAAEPVIVGRDNLEVAALAL
jgi:hypothetical protein